MIIRHTEETRRPSEWLLRFQEDGRRYNALLRDSGGLAVAAYRLARARCRVQPVPSTIPTRTELWAAARCIIQHTGIAESPPTKRRLAGDCEKSGLVVIGPPGATRAA